MAGYCVKLCDDNPVAVVLGGKYDGRKVSIVEKGKGRRDESEEDERDPFEQLDISDFVENFAMMDVDERRSIVRALRNRKAPQKFAKKYSESCSREFKIDSGQMVIMPTEKTERVYIAGKSGVGKSSIASMYCREYREMFPNRRIILISTHSDEDAYKMFDVDKIPLDDDFMESPPQLEDLSDSLVIFDDTDNLTSKKLQESVKNVNSNLISNGRKYNIHVITMSHQVMDYSRTRHLLNEANRVVLFLGTGAYHTKRYLKEYAGLDKDQIKKVLGLKSRWVCLGLTVPNYIVAQGEVSLL